MTKGIVRNNAEEKRFLFVIVEYGATFPGIEVKAISKYWKMPINERAKEQTVMDWNR